MSQPVLLLLAMSFSFLSMNGKKVHHCVHDKLNLPTPQQTHIKYAYDINLMNKHESGDRRRLHIPIEEYEKIRIKPYWGDIDASSSLTTTTKDTIKAIMSSAINYFESFLSVIPVDGPLFVQRTCNLGYPKEGPLHSYFNCAADEDDAWTQQCGEVEIPSSHLRNDWAYPATSNNDIDVSSYPRGNGLQDTDLIIYVSAVTDESCAGGGTLAWAVACQLDQYGRPVSGTINFCPLTLEEQDWKMDILTTIHELTHVFVFHDYLFSLFIDQFGNKLEIDDVITQVSRKELGLNNSYIITPKVQAFVREHYDCVDLIGAPLEDDGGSGTAGSHWEEHHVNGEYMIGTSYSHMQYVSGLTLALFEDSGWYKVDYNYSEPFTWGKNEGCKFFEEACFKYNTNSQTKESNFPQYFCGPNDLHSLCTYDAAARAQCLYYYNNSQVPDMFKFFSDVEHGKYGTEKSEFCPFADSVSHPSVNDFQYICWDTRGTTLDSVNNNFGQVYGINSRCVEGNIVSDNWGMESFCFPMNCDLNNDSLIIIINSAQIICKKEDAFMSKHLSDDGQGNSYNITCPKYESICVNHKPFQCLWGFWNNILNKCVCSAGYGGNICDQSLINNVVNSGVQLYPNIYYNGYDGFNGTVCLKLGINIQEINGDWQYVSVYKNIYPYYQKDNYYLYFEPVYHLWTIGTILGDEYEETSVIAICSIGERPYDVSDCSHMFYFVDDNHNQWTQDINLVIGNFGCPVSPTPSPTLCPTCDDLTRIINTFYTVGDTPNPTQSPDNVDGASKEMHILSLCVSIFFVVMF